MKYTMSKDGVARCTVNLKMRLTHTEYLTLSQIAKRQGHTSVQSLLEQLLLDDEYLNTQLRDLEIDTF